MTEDKTWQKAVGTLGIRPLALILLFPDTPKIRVADACAYDEGRRESGQEHLFSMFAGSAETSRDSFDPLRSTPKNRQQ